MTDAEASGLSELAWGWNPQWNNGGKGVTPRYHSCRSRGGWQSHADGKVHLWWLMRSLWDTYLFQCLYFPEVGTIGMTEFMQRQRHM